MSRIFGVALLLVIVLSLPTVAAAQYPVQDRLCDVASTNCRTQILDLINAETQSIDVAFWFMEDGRYSAALIRRFQAGVKVRVLFDTEAFTGKDAAVRQQIITDMKNAGIPLRYKSTGGILHWKLMVFGGQRIVNFSAANFSSTGYVPVTPYQNYEDEVIVFTTDAGLVDTFMTKYDDVWTSTSGYTNYANVTTLDRYHPTFPLDPRLNFPPTQDYGKKISSQIDKETVAVDIDMYRITDARPADAAIRAVQRGVPVRLYTEQEQYRDVTRLWHSYNVDRMYAAGVQVKDRAHEGLNHQKTVILRGQGMVVHGSSNWTTPSASQQLEHNLFTTDPTFYNFFVSQFERKWNNTGPSPETRVFTPLPPDKPVTPTPADTATGQSTSNVVLKWYGGPWAHKYDIYFGTTPTPPLLVADVQLGPSENARDFQTYTVPGPLVAGTTYYWKVVSKTMANMTAAGPVWTFTTTGTAPAGSGALPSGWSTSDVGSVGAAGSATYDGTSGTYVVQGSGADIWGTADAFRFVYSDLTGDGEIVARVASVSNTDRWTKAGVMMRDTLDPGSAQASMFVSAQKGLAFQRRVTAGGTSTNTAGPLATAPYFVKMTRAGNTFTAAVSTDGATWNVVGSETIAMGSTIKVGLALTSHADGAVATASFDGVTVTGGGAPPPPPPPALPTGWSSSDIGTASPAGSAAFDTTTNTFTVQGAGADVWNSADAFRYAYTTLTGDGEIVAHVASVQNVNAWTKAGVMLRDMLSAGSAHAFMLVSPGKGTAFQRRVTANGLSTNTAGPFAAAPYWVKLTRVGNTFTAYASADGTTWTTVGSDTIAMGATINAGLAVSSHVNGTLATATFDSVVVTKY
jgi:phosphatidylserine/phosphatidylglycerophosphate/cardiolipin synthase-like enzyme/regulation of enolase protein 1 (concanavalin A-like superfamily)